MPRLSGVSIFFVAREVKSEKKEVKAERDGKIFKVHLDLLEHVSVTFWLEARLRAAGKWIRKRFFESDSNYPRGRSKKAQNPNGKNAKEYRGIIGSFISGGYSRNANPHTGSTKERERQLSYCLIGEAACQKSIRLCNLGFHIKWENTWSALLVHRKMIRY